MKLNKTMTHLFIINPRTFELNNNMQKVIDEIQQYFSQTASCFEIYISKYPRDAVAIVRKFILASQEEVRVYAIGGDGILFDCLNGLIGTKNSALASVPYSTPNSFLRSFGQPNYDIFRNIEQQARGNVIPTDVINCNDNYALNYCTIGIEAASNRIVKDTNQKLLEQLRYKLTNNLFYIGCSIGALLKKDVLHQFYEIAIDGQRYDGHYSAINIANTHCYSRSFVISKDACPNDGFLEITLVKSCSVTKCVSLLPKYLKGLSPLYPEDIIQKRCKQIEIKSYSPIYLDLDGEVFFDSKLSIKVEPLAINFITPKNVSYVKKAGVSNET